MELKEILTIAFKAIRANKLRSVLTLLGVVVGVFSIIGVMTAVQVLQNSIESGLSNLGTNTFQIQKFPALFTGGHAQWDKFRRRKDITLTQAEYVAEKMTTARYVAFEAWSWGKTIQTMSGEKTNPNVTVAGEVPDGIPTNNWTIKEGRSFSDNDQTYANKVVILGQGIVTKLFPKGGAIGQEVKIQNERFKVIGIFDPQGAALGGNNDNFVAIPLSSFLNKFGKMRSLNIMIKAKTQEVYEQCMEEARLALRIARKVEPGADDDFEIFSNDSLISTFNDFTKYVKMGIGFISFISLLAAGVGIMNIMLVSVTERTKEIGLRKSVGARKSNILSQFITEAVVLCQMGGVVGIGLGVIGGNLAALAFSIPPVFPVDWAIIGFVLCAFIGVVFGVYPAWKAANLDPIEALRYE
ncbi:MAG TPA: peptide ABC transporter permease [Bacteroidetes bacterium]|nr:peptide ABC transporter permease [Bacteroidota bacterium]